MKDSSENQGQVLDPTDYSSRNSIADSNYPLSH